MINISIIGQWMRGGLYSTGALCGYLGSNEAYRQLYGAEVCLWTGALGVLCITIRAYLDRSPGSELPQPSIPGFPAEKIVEHTTRETTTVSETNTESSGETARNDEEESNERERGESYDKDSAG